MNVRFTPKSGHWDSVAKCPLCAKRRHFALKQRTSLFDYLVGDSEYARRDRQSERLGCLEIDDQFEFRRPEYRHVGGLFAFEDATGIYAGLAIGVGEPCAVAD